MIWVVTNHHDTRRAVATLVAAKGYEIKEIDCGAEVVTRLQFQSPSLIILDCGVPDSFDMLVTVRSQPRAGRVPVVMFSIDNENLRDRCLLAGADAYVPKGSLDWVELLEEVVRYAGPPRGGKTASEEAADSLD